MPVLKVTKTNKKGSKLVYLKKGSIVVPSKFAHKVKSKIVIKI